MLLRSSWLVLGTVALLSSLVVASDREHWADIAAKSKDGIIKLDSASYEDLLSDGRDYSVSVVLTALPQRFKCTPCHEFEPAWHQVSNSWRRVASNERDYHFFAQLDFSDGEAVFRKMSLSTAPKVYFHPAQTGPNKSNKLSVVSYDLERVGLTAQALHGWVSNLTPTSFSLHTPFNPVPLVMIPFTIGTMIFAAWSARAFLIPVVQSRIVWGAMSFILILTFTSGYMWNKIKNAPYIHVDQSGRVSWFAGGYQNQLGLESQVVAGVYGTLSFIIVALTIFVPAQSSPSKQRIGVYLWLAMFVVVFSLLVKLFRIKNGAYPYSLLF